MIDSGPFAQINLRRWYPAPRAIVFRAFIEADLVERWFFPSPDVRVRVAHLEPRVGGRYRFVYRFPDGTEAVVLGEYRRLDAPHHLAFTWTWESPDLHAGAETLVTVDLHEKDEGTELVLSHVRFPTEEIMRRHDIGWVGTLDQLSALVAACKP